MNKTISSLPKEFIDPFKNIRKLILTLIGFAFFPVSIRALDFSPEMLQEKLMADRTSESETKDNSQGVDSTTYIVGPGDGFQIHVKEIPNQMFNAMISETGSLFIKDFGEIQVGRLPLIRAYETIRQRVLGSLRKEGHVYVTLNKVKSPTVSVTGPFPNQGTVQMKGTNRIFDAIKTANKGEKLSILSADLRNVTVRNGDSVKTFDIMLFMKNNDLTENPYVYPGDEIVVPFTNHTILIGGQIAWPRERQIPLHKGESLSAMLGLLILKPNADTNTILVRRLSGSLEKVSYSQAGNFHLEDNDLIIIPSHDRIFNTDTASIGGEVLQPGTIPIEPGKTTAAEALQLAGGPTMNGDIFRAYLLRHGKMHHKEDAGLAENATSGNLVQKPETPTQIRPEMNFSLDNLLASNDYAVLMLRDHLSDVFLEAGDEVYVPRQERYIYISGQVGQPGAYLFHSGWSFEDYVEKAGGYTPKADSKNSYVVTYYRQAYQIKDQKSVQSGDIIVVPASVEYKRFTTIFLPVTQVVLSVFSLALSIAVLTGLKL